LRSTIILNILVVAAATLLRIRVFEVCEKGSTSQKGVTAAEVYHQILDRNSKVLIPLLLLLSWTVDTQETQQTYLFFTNVYSLTFCLVAGVLIFSFLVKIATKKKS